MNISKDSSLLKFHLESVEAGGSNLVDGDVYEVVGENESSWDISLSMLCGAALKRIKHLEYLLSRYSMDAGQADQRQAESRAARIALGFPENSDDVSPSDIRQALKRRDARMKSEALHNAVCVLESEFDPCHPIIERVESLEAELRRQAEEI